MSKESVRNAQIPIVEGLFTWPSDEPHLIGGRCKTCGTYFFPRNYVTHRPDCNNEELEEVLLNKKGKLRSYTWEHYPPPPPFKGPDPFVPFGIGLVELPEGINVVGIMSGCEFEDMKIGMDVELVVEKQYTDEQGNEFLTWKFRPI